MMRKFSMLELTYRGIIIDDALRYQFDMKRLLSYLLMSSYSEEKQHSLLYIET
jgi:hypothetical protein